MGISTDTFAASAREMLKLYEESERRLIKLLSERLAQGVDLPVWAQRKYAEARQMRQELEKLLADLARQRGKLVNEAIIDAYTGASEAYRREGAQENPYAAALDMGGNSAKAASIISDLTERLDAADRTILRRADDAYADIVARSTALVANGTITLRQAVAEELDDFARQGISSFIDSAGRAWDMSTYAEMATLTAIERATREGYINTMKEYGHDLAVISSHAGACPLCVAWEDVIISVSGDNKDYPSLADAEAGGCFHPRCLHVISTYYEDITPGGKNAPAPVREPSEAYSARQQKRYYERQVRAWKRRMSAAIDRDDERKALAHARQYQAKIRDLIDSYNARTPGSADQLMRDWSHEGARAVLSKQR